MRHKEHLIRVAVTGGPGAGKTSLLETLQARGYAVVPEVARQIIATRKAKGLPPRPPPAEFAWMILAKDIEQYGATAAKGGRIFFDRTLLDALGMLAQLDQLREEDKRRLLERYPYHPTAFILPPWRDIYRTDAERDQTYEEAKKAYVSLRKWYTGCGYRLVEVPHGTAGERGDFVLQSLGEKFR